MISPIPNSNLINYQKVHNPQGLSNHNRMLSSIIPNSNNHYQILNSPNIQQTNYNMFINNNNNYNANYINQKFPPQSQFNYYKGNAFFEIPINYNYNNLSPTHFNKTINNNTIRNVNNINNIQIHNKIPLSKLTNNNILFINRNNNFLNQTLNRNNSHNNILNNMKFYQPINATENMHLENSKIPVKKNNSNISKDKVIKRNGKPIMNIDMNNDFQGDLSCSNLKTSFNNKNNNKSNDNNNYNTININMLNNNEIDKNYKVKKIKISPFSLSNDQKHKNLSKVKQKRNTINDNNQIKSNINKNNSSASKNKNKDKTMKIFDISINNQDKTIKNNSRIKTIHRMKDSSNNIKIIKGKDNESNNENNIFINNYDILNSDKIQNKYNDYDISIDKGKTISGTNNIDNYFKNKTPDKKEEKFNFNSKKNNKSIEGIIMIEKNQRRNKTPSVNKRNNAKINNLNNITDFSNNNQEDTIKLNNKNSNNINFLTIRNMNNISARNKNQINPNKNKSINIKTNKISINLPPTKTNNIKGNTSFNDDMNDTKEKLNKDKNIKNISLNRDIEEDVGEIKINNLLNKLENKIKFTTPKEKETIESINNINTIKKNITNNNEQKKGTKIKFSKDVNYFKYCIYKSSAGKDSFGKRKVNQDVYLVKINMNDIEGFNLFGVLDGHGENGHLVSRFARNFIIEEIQNNIQKSNKKSLSEIYSLLIKDNYSLIKKAYQKVDKELSKQNFNANFSGSTCVIVFQIGNNLISANVGDSRAILIQSENANDDKLEKAKIVELSIDQKPDLPEEKKRIYKMGGIVDQMLDGKGKRNGPFRVWAGKQNYPGIAMSRSFGDLKGKKCGLISEPEIIEYKLDEKSKYMVICSDGVWEFLNNEDVMNIGIKYYINNDINGFINDLIQLSQYWWKKEDIIMDDITSVIVYF